MTGFTERFGHPRTLIRRLRERKLLGSRDSPQLFANFSLTRHHSSILAVVTAVSSVSSIAPAGAASRLVLRADEWSDGTRLSREIGRRSPARASSRRLPSTLLSRSTC